MLFKPSCKLIPCHAARCQIKHQPLLFINGSHDLISVQRQEHFHRGVGNTLVAVDEGMVQGKRKAECRRFRWHRSVQVSPAKAGARLCEGRLQGAEIADA